MSELQKLRDAVEDVFKRISKRVGHRNILTHTKLSERELYPVREHIAEALKGLTLLAAEQEALSPQGHKPGDIMWAKYANAISGVQLNEKTSLSESKGSSVEYYKDRLVAATIACVKNDAKYAFWNSLGTALEEYKAALAASPDPEGEWQWVPSTCAVVPLEPTTDMLYFGEMAEPNLRAFHPGKVYTAMLRARPPVPKKGERG